MEGSKRTTSRFGHFALQQAKRQKDTMFDRKFVIKQYIKFKSIVTPTCEKNLWRPSQKWNYDSYLQENQGLQTTYSCNLYQVSLKSGQFAGVKDATSGVNIYCSDLIKPQIVY